MPSPLPIFSRRIPGIVLCLSCLLPPALCGLQTPDANRPAVQAEALRQEAHAAMQAGNKNEALGLLARARSADPGNPDILFDFGMAALDLNLYLDSSRALTQELKIRPDDPKGIYALARAQMGLRHYQEAAQSLRHYLELRPNDASAHFGLGYILRLLRQNTEARKELNTSLRLHPEQTESVFQLGVIDLEENHRDQAAQRFQQVLQRNPQHSGALLGLGQLEFENAHYKAAKKWLTAAIRIVPGLYKAHYYLGLSEARLGDKDGARKELALAEQIQHQQDEQSRILYRIMPPPTAPGDQPAVTAH